MCALLVASEGFLPVSGSRIGSYELIRPIGRGGMGLVFMARDLTLGRRVAIKFLRADAEQALAQRFVLEARATARCTHENIVVIHEVSSHEGLPYMVLEYLEGSTLAQLCAEQPLPMSRAVPLLTAVARAMACAHDANIIHRDLKPENIFVTRRGVVKVLDFGISTLLRANDDSSRRDLAAQAQVDRGRVYGTAPYMAPEQWRAEEPDGRADIFSFGVILFRALTGAHPAGTTTREGLEAAVRRPEPFASISRLAPSLPDRLVQVVDRCLAKQRDQRFASAHELVAALEQLDPRASARRSDDDCPYPGLLGFSTRDADRYFGRARDLQQALELLRTRPVLAVVGQSGAGKSSFAHAGVAAWLGAEPLPWRTLSLRPGPRPLHSLASALAQLGPRDAPSAALLGGEPGRLGQWLRQWCSERSARVVIIVDQAEEMFSLCRDAHERRAFLANLLGAADDVAAPVRLLLTLRSDFLQEIAAYPDLAELVVQGVQLLAPLDEGSLRAALEGPLTLAGYRFAEPGLAENIAAAFTGAPHALPMLQTVAVQLWAQRDRQTRTIPRAAIQAIGGVAGALARYADQVLAALAREDEKVAAAVLTRLVTARGTRTSAPRADLERLSPAAPLVVQTLLAARLLVEHESESTLELAHEVLITSWPRLAAWLEASRLEHAARERLEHAAAAWQAHDRAAELLWDGEALTSAEALAGSGALAATPGAAAFVAAATWRRDRKRRRRKLVLAGAGTLVASIAIASTLGLAMVHRAERQASEHAARATAEAARSVQAERALADKVRILEETEARRAHAAAEAEGRQLEVRAQREVIERREEALARALDEANALLAERDASLRAGERLRLELERALGRERDSLARERARAEALARRQAKIIGELPQ